MTPKQSETGKFFRGGQLNLPELEKKVLESWRARRTFEKSLEARRGKKRFVFYEGPPTANGKPGIHHVLARSFKDIILRYKTMRGFFVPRKGGWDTHGLPVEIEVEKKLGLRSKKDIEAYGVAAFNQKCRESVWQYKDEWEKLTERMGYWLDLENPYITYETNYIETLWRIIKNIWEKKLLYQGHKVVPWCTRCGTALSSHELGQPGGYREVTDQSVYVKFKLKKGQKIGKWITTGSTYILSWTTTPWTLPGNVALAVGGEIEYLVVKRFTGEWHNSGNAIYDHVIIAKDIFDRYEKSPELVEAQPFHFIWPATPDGYEVTQGPVIECSARGSDLIGLSYEPLFDVTSLKNDKSYKIYDAKFVTTTEGTGVVHTAVMYGEDDYQLGIKTGLPQHHTVDERGKFTKEVPGLDGLYVKAKETEEKIFRHLKENGNFLETKSYEHEYPHCWRCGTLLLYYARTSWFVAMTKLRAKLLSNNKKINWIPAHLKEGRFGEWLKDVKDWNFSRERYWGTPLPIWECAACKHREVIGGLGELSAKLGAPRNTYFVMRHGHAENLLRNIIDSGQKELHLTTIGKDQVRHAAQTLKKEKFDLIVASDILRTKETALMVAEALGGTRVVFDKRLREIHLPSFSGCHSGEYHNRYPTYRSRFEERPEGGESLRDLRARMWDAVQSLEKEYHGKKILIISHEYPIWMLTHAASGLSEAEAIREKTALGTEDFIKVATVRKLDLKLLPRNETGEADLHRPYIDEAAWQCAKCSGTTHRIKELADVWFDSGSMPFAQVHWPFAGDKQSRAKGKKEVLEYPAECITEAVDQTRGWFYTLLAVGTLLGRGAPYKNVISLGLINDKSGQKMSKSKGNIVDPWSMAEKYGMDAVRWYFYTVNPPGEPKNFDEAEIVKTFRRVHSIVYNSFVFFDSYRASGVSRERKAAPKHMLDTWILSRLNATSLDATRHLERYDIREAALVLEGFVDDLSRWYIRRSRKRFQRPISQEDHRDASATLGFVLRELAKLLAPFSPFFAEALHEELGGADSVHLEDWPKVSSRAANKSLAAQMAEVRRLASLGLAARAASGIKVRQPLSLFKVKDRGSKLKIGKELLRILADEVNVKEVVVTRALKDEVELDTTITPELREEGIVREIARMAQDLRQEAGLRPKDSIVLMAQVPAGLREVLEGREDILKREIGARAVEYKKSDKFAAEIKTKFDNLDIWLAIRKA